MIKILVTGSAGFIGYHLVKSLASKSFEVVGLDNINNYYNVDLKYGRLEETGIERSKIKENQLIKSIKFSNYRFIKLDLEDEKGILHLFKSEGFDVVCHLAAQSGVRHSAKTPLSYINSNVVGFINILEACRNFSIKHLAYASSSSIYGLNEKTPYATSDNTDHPVSLYAATKKSNELMAHSYSHLFNIPTTGLRFFTVYGSWGRPDMAIFLFTKAILEGKPIQIFNNGDLQRDFTYVEDIVAGLEKIIHTPPIKNENWNNIDSDISESKAPYKIFNLGNNSPIKILDFIESIEKALDKKAIKEYMPMQPGDVHKTWADCSDFQNKTGYKPNTPLDEGIKYFTNWYQNFYKF